MNRYGIKGAFPLALARFFLYSQAMPKRPPGLPIDAEDLLQTDQGSLIFLVEVSGIICGCIFF